MSDNLPLIPGKGTVCGDVRGVLRDVFREGGAHAPPHATPGDTPCPLPAIQDAHWKSKYQRECEELARCEASLRQEFARVAARPPRGNAFRLCARADCDSRDCRPRLRRPHLAPGVRQHATREVSLWVRNIQSSSSATLSASRSPPPASPRHLARPPADDISTGSLSIGPARAPPRPPLPSPPAEPPLPDYILCVPPRLDFVNFVVGQEHKQTVRLINLSKVELRLSVSPPARRELRVSVGARGQRVTAGAAALLTVHFTPSDGRALREDLGVRVSAGKALVIPVDCYMQPPVLEVLVPLEQGSERGGEFEGACVAGCGLADVLDLGARLLGDVHRVPLLMHCSAKHAAFFLISDDSWIHYNLEGITSGGALVCEPFSWWPAWWRGGGAVRGLVWCRARCSGLHAAPLRLLSSTAAARPLCLLADTLYFRRDHITLEAHEKDYDICSEDDPGCEYYVHLGTAFPGRALSTTMQLINHSPVSYSFYWSARPWGLCACRGDECEGALQRPQTGDDDAALEQSWRGVRVEPPRGRVSPRSALPLRVSAPDAGQQLGVQRAALMLILKDIPKESFPPGYDPMIINCETVESEQVPGVENKPREVCEVVCCEMEVWWEVAPVRFVLDPPLIRLSHSRRVQEVCVSVRATQLFGRDPLRAAWRLSPGVPPRAVPAALLTPAQSLVTNFLVSLPSLPDQAIPHQKIDVIELVGAGEEWRSSCTVQRAGARRALRLRPARRWLGIAAPGAHVAADLAVHNDTYQPVSWACAAVRWCGAVSGGARCEGRAPCAVCRVRGCACALLWPTAGQLAHGDSEPIRFAVYAPERDGCVLIVVNARRPLAGDCGRAALLGVRVLAPRLALHVAACEGDHRPGGACECCALDARCAAGVVRPRGPLWRGRRVCCRLRLRNLTPVPTTVTWEPPLRADEPLRVTFTPNEVAVCGYETVEIQVTLSPERVCARRLFVRRAHAQHTSTPLYVLVDTDITGVEVTCEVPLGAGPEPSSFVLVRRAQKETPRAKFTVEPEGGGEGEEEEVEGEEGEEEDEFERFEREQIEYRKKLFACRCPTAPLLASPSPRTPASLETPLSYKGEPVCLQFKQLPLATERVRTLVLRNVSALPARWAARVRRWPRRRLCSLAADKWSVDVRDPGVALQVRPAGGELRAGRGARGGGRGDSARLSLHVYADCAGLYHDQLLIEIQDVEPIVLDVWVEALGEPLKFAAAPTLWMSPADEQRWVRARNVTRSPLAVTAYLLHEHEDARDREPLRLYLRLEDREPPPPSPPPSDLDLSWCTAGEQSSSSASPQPAIGVELALFADHGRQGLTPYQVEPESCVVAAGADVRWRVWRRGAGALRRDAVLLLRCRPLHRAGDNWFRPSPPPQTVSLRAAPRGGRVQLAGSELRVRVCALALPANEELRIRKRFQVLNVGDGPISVAVAVCEPWSMVRETGAAAGGQGGKAGAGAAPRCGGGCGARAHRERDDELMLSLLPRSSTEVCVEVRIPPSAASPAPLPAPEPRAPPYHTAAVTATTLTIRDDDDIQAEMKLVLELEYPRVLVQPHVLSFGFVTDGDTRKGYFTVSHSSRTETLDLEVCWSGPAGVRLHPLRLRLPPADQQRVYVQYTAQWCGAPMEGRVEVSARGAAWCAAGVSLRAAPCRDLKCRAAPHDHTDDAQLAPPHCPHDRA